MIFILLSASEFIIFYELGEIEFYKPLMLMLSGLVLLIIAILVSHSKSGRLNLI